MPTHHTYNVKAPSIIRRGMVYYRPWADFILPMMDMAMQNYYVTEATAKSYAYVAIKPFEKELEHHKYQKAFLRI